MVPRECSKIVLLCLVLLPCAVLTANQPPVAVDDGPYITDEDPEVPVQGNVLANDYDPDPPDTIINAVLMAEPQHGTLEFNEETGAFVYTPDENWYGTDVFSYKCYDNHYLPSEKTARVTIVVKPDYVDPPEPEDQTVTTQMNMPVTITLSAVIIDNLWEPPEGDTVVAWEVTSGPSHGTVSAFTNLQNEEKSATAQIVYTPDENFTGTDSFTFRCQDSDGFWSDAEWEDGVVMITVTDDLVITGLSPGGYVLQQKLDLRDSCYADRGYTFTFLPAFLKNDALYYLVKTANDDKFVASGAHVSFQVNQSVTVYIGYDARASSTPAWMSGFSDTGITVGMATSEGESSRLKLYAKQFTDKTIVLGGNNGGSSGTGAYANYVLIVRADKEGLATPIPTNGLPTADAQADKTTGTAPLTVNFDGSGSTDDGGITAYAWDFGDGSSAAGATASHTYTEVGVYRVVLTVTDDGTPGLTATDTITVTVAEPAGVQVSKVSRSGYAVDRLYEGSRLYVDRSYTITSIPDSLEGAKGIRTKNDDKNATATSFLSFDVDQAVDVYVLYDARAGSLPSWMSGFTDTGLTVTTTVGGASPMKVYSKTFAAGTVVLGGNHAGGDTGALSNYVVLVMKAGQVDPGAGTSVTEGSWTHADDSDGDGLGDAFEDANGLDKFTVDSDGDGIVDEDEDAGGGQTYFDKYQAEKQSSGDEEADDGGGGSGGCLPAAGCHGAGCAAGMMIPLLWGLWFVVRRRRVS